MLSLTSGQSDRRAGVAHCANAAIFLERENSLTPQGDA